MKINALGVVRVESCPRYEDDELYQRRYVIERANAWLDGYEALLVRFETKVKNWVALTFLVFVVLFLKKIKHKK